MLQRTSFIRLFVLICPLLLLLNTSVSFGQEAQAIGRVVSTTGMVTASNEAGDVRELQRRSEIFAGDTITTGPNSFASLRMVDSAQIAFKENTIFAFQTYNTDGAGGAPDNALMNMVQGGFRTISGSIGDSAGDSYEVVTQFASIGIRGTTHEAVIDAGRLLTGVYDGGTTISNAQGSLDTGEGANFNYSQTFPGQAPQGLLQQPAQLGQININPGADNNGDDDDDANDGNNDNDNNDGDEGDGGLADADDEEPATRPLGNQQNNNNDPDQRFGLAGNTDPDNDQDPSNDIGRTDNQINPALSVRGSDDFQSTGTGTVGNGNQNPDPAPPTDPGFAQPSAAFLALAANSGFNTDFSLSELAGTTGRVNQVLAFSGLANTGGIAATAVDQNSPTTPITALNMSFDLNFSASLGQVSNGHLEILLGNASIPITYNIYFDGTIASSVANFIIASNSNRIQGNTTTQINLNTSFLDGILVDDGSAQALFTEFFFEDTQGLGVEGETLVGFATPVLSPADRVSVAQRVGFVLSRSAAPGAIFPGNVTELAPGQNIILAGSDPEAPFSVSLEPPYVFRGTGSFLAFTDGTITEEGENPYDFEIGVWNTGRLYEDYADNTDFTDILQPLVVVSVDPASLTSLTGSRTYLTNYDRILGSSSAGSITEFFTAFDVDFTTALVTNGSMEFCLGGGEFCNNANSQYWSFDYSGSVIDGYVVAQPVNNAGYINHQLASIFGQIEGVFTGEDGEAFVGGFNLFYDADLDIFRNQVASAQVSIPDTSVDGVFLIEEEQRFSAAEVDNNLDYDGFLVQERLARILLGYTRPTTNDPVLFIDQRSRPRLVLRDDTEALVISKRNENLLEPISNAFNVNWERWEGSLAAYNNNLDGSSVLIDGAIAEVPLDPVSFFATFKHSEMTDIQGHYDQVLGYIGEDGNGTPISYLSMSFDINFSASMNNIENGSLSFQTSYYQYWQVFFDGTLNRNIVEFNLLNENPNNPGEYSGIYCDGLCSSLNTSDSNMQGAIVTGHGYAGSEYPALLSSFYFRDGNVGDPERSTVSGLALVGRDDLDFIDIALPSILTQEEYQAAQLAEQQGYAGIINIPGLGSTLDTVLGLDFNAVANNSIDIFAVDQVGNPSYDDYLAVYEFNRSFAEIGASNTFSSSGDTYNLQLAYWDEPAAMGDLTRLYTQYGSNYYIESTYNTPLFWNNYTPTEFNNLNGRFSTVLKAFGVIDYQNTDSMVSVSKAIDHFDMEFTVDFASASISNGILHSSVQADDFGSSGIEYNWDAYFYGVVSGADTSLTFSYAKFYESVNGSAGSYFDAVSATNGAANIIASFTGDTDTPILTGSYAFNYSDMYSPSILASAAGNFATTGVVDARLSATQLYQMDHHLAMIVDGAYVNGSSELVPGSISFGRATHPVYSGGTSPFIGVINRGSQDFNNLNLELDTPFTEVLTGNSTAVSDLGYELDVIDSEASYNYQIALGYWDSPNMTVYHNQLDASQTSGLDHEIFWANIIPTDISNLEGEYIYNSTGDFFGNGSAGAVHSLSMDFTVNFDTATIGAGALNVYAGSDSWLTDFSGGTINGSLVQFTGISGDYSGSVNSCMACVEGVIGGVFAEDVYETLHNGFAAGFSLTNSAGTSFEDFVQGVSILSGIPAMPPL